MNGRSRGRTVEERHWQPDSRYRLDTSLGSPHAAALRVAGWDIVSVDELFGVDSTVSILDEEIIPRCGREGRTWLTVDERARFRHAELTKQHLVSVVWITRPNDGLSVAYVHALLARALLKVDPEFAAHPDFALQFRLGWTLEARPREHWRARKPR